MSVDNKIKRKPAGKDSRFGLSGMLCLDIKLEKGIHLEAKEFEDLPIEVQEALNNGIPIKAEKGGKPNRAVSFDR